MKEIIKKMSAMLTVAAIALIASLSLTSCSDDPESDIIYNMGISKMESSSLESLADMDVIYDAYYKAIGVSENTFIMKGNSSDNDKKIKEACEKAELSLKDQTWKGTYTFRVTNVNTNKVIYEHTFSKDDNFIF